MGLPAGRDFPGQARLTRKSGLDQVANCGKRRIAVRQAGRHIVVRHSVPLSPFLFLIPVALGFAHKPENRPRFIGLALFAFVPTGVAFAASFLLPSAVFEESYLIIVVVPYLLMVTLGNFLCVPAACPENICGCDAVLERLGRSPVSHGSHPEAPLALGRARGAHSKHSRPRHY